jgi:hypothetical protein
VVVAFSAIDSVDQPGHSRPGCWVWVTRWNDDPAVPRNAHCNRFASHMHGVLGQEGTPPGELLARARAEVEGYGVETAGRSATVASACSPPRR